MNKPNILTAADQSSRNYYKRYKKAYLLENKMAEYYEKEIALLTTNSETDASDTALKLAKTVFRLEECKAHISAEEITTSARRVYNRHPDAFFELALMDAYIHGVEILVREPLEIGVRVDLPLPN